VLAFFAQRSQIRCERGGRPAHTVRVNDGAGRLESQIGSDAVQKASIESIGVSRQARIVEPLSFAWRHSLSRISLDSDS
jgi:hypothetical protein